MEIQEQIRLDLQRQANSALVADVRIGYAQILSGTELVRKEFKIRMPDTFAANERRNAGKKIYNAAGEYISPTIRAAKESYEERSWCFLKYYPNDQQDKLLPIFPTRVRREQ